MPGGYPHTSCSRRVAEKVWPVAHQELHQVELDGWSSAARSGVRSSKLRVSRITCPTRISLGGELTLARAQQGLDLQLGHADRRAW